MPASGWRSQLRRPCAAEMSIRTVAGSDMATACWARSPPSSSAARRRGDDPQVAIGEKVAVFQRLCGTEATRRSPMARARRGGSFGVGRSFVERRREARQIHERSDDAARELALYRHVSAGLLVGDTAFILIKIHLPSTSGRRLDLLDPHAAARNVLRSRSSPVSCPAFPRRRRAGCPGAVQVVQPAADLFWAMLPVVLCALRAPSRSRGATMKRLLHRRKMPSNSTACMMLLRKSIDVRHTSMRISQTKGQDELKI